MPKRETVFASAILAALVPAMVLSVGLHHAQGAANNCLAKPNAAPPRGQPLVLPRGPSRQPSLLVSGAGRRVAAPGLVAEAGTQPATQAGIAAEGNGNGAICRP